MPRHAALLRGINVGGKNKVAMADLRSWCTDAGLDDVATYVQSGNVVFSSSQRSKAKLEQLIATAIADGSGLDISVMVRSARDLAAVVDDNPFASDDLPPTQLVVAFSKAKASTTSLDLSDLGPETAEVRGTHVYLHYPNGQGRSKVTNAVLERRLGTPVTSRNWNSVVKLRDMTSADT